MAASELLGSAGVTESNMMQYLGIIEERTNQLVAELGGTVEENNALAQALRGEDDEEHDLQQQRLAGTGSMQEESAAGGPVSIQAPSVDEDADEDEEEEDGEDGEEHDEDAAQRRHADAAADEDEGDYADEQPLSEQELRGGGD